MAPDKQKTNSTHTPKTPFFRRNHHERVVLTAKQLPLSRAPDSAVAFSPYHPYYPTMKKQPLSPALNQQPIPFSLQVRRTPVPAWMTTSASPSSVPPATPVPNSSSRHTAPTSESASPVSTQWTSPSPSPRQLSPLSMTTPEPSTPVSSYDTVPARNALLRSAFADPIGFPSLNKSLFGRDSTPPPQLPPLHTDSAPCKNTRDSSRQNKDFTTMIPVRKTFHLEMLARPATTSPDATPSKAEKVLGHKFDPCEALRVKEIEIIKTRKSRIPSALRFLSKFGLSGVKDEGYNEAVPVRLIPTTTPSPTRSTFPRVSSPYNLTHVSGIFPHGVLLNESPRTTSELPSPPQTSHTLSSGPEDDETPPSSISGSIPMPTKDLRVVQCESELSNCGAFNMSDLESFSHPTTNKAEAFKSRSKIPRSPNGGSSTTPIRFGRRYLQDGLEQAEESASESDFSTPTRLSLMRNPNGKKAKKNVQNVVAMPQHRFKLSTAESINKALPPLPTDTTSSQSVVSPTMKQFDSMDEHMSYLDSLHSTDEVSGHFSTILSSPRSTSQESTGNRLFPAQSAKPTRTAPSPSPYFAQCQGHASLQPRGVSSKRLQPQLKAHSSPFILLPAPTGTAINTSDEDLIDSSTEKETVIPILPPSTPPSPTSHSSSDAQTDEGPVELAAKPVVWPAVVQMQEEEEKQKQRVTRERDVDFVMVTPADGEGARKEKLPLGKKVARVWGKMFGRGDKKV